MTAEAGDGQGTVTFSPSPSAAVSYYTVTAFPGGKSANGQESPITVTGLKNGTTYSFSVSATNVSGRGPESVSSNAVVPASIRAARCRPAARPGAARARSRAAARSGSATEAAGALTAAGRVGGACAAGCWCSRSALLSGRLHGRRVAGATTTTDDRDDTAPASAAERAVGAPRSMRSPRASCSICGRSSS